METRLDRLALLWGKDAVNRLHSAKVLVIGCGAVGSYAIEALARGGIGHLGLVDFDVVSISNINRQLFALNSTVGELKTTVAVRRIKDISPDIETTVFNVKTDSAKTEEILNQFKPDFVIDAIDSLGAKVDLIEKLQEMKIPFISSMGAALKENVGNIATAKMKNTKNCTLAAFVRKRLRRRNVDLNFPCVYSDELPIKAIETGENEERSKLGSLPTVTGIFGLYAAHYALRYLKG